ncbi:DUF1132 family protein [Neisseria mucosa]|uniref:DUF1132 family protein n=1 Tax=Neisseria mucosa TaxID=488 RepID=UPI00051CE955|nr:DUF1132 family protein [Neisseria mucosa]KGJ31050.1 hypothetical protein ES17_08895 [Neisseria mucosa]
MKPFITEAELALFKYQLESKYFGRTFAIIFSEEILEFSKKNKFMIIEQIQWFLNRKISNDVWKIYFNDDSVLYIKIHNLKADYRDIEIQTFDFNPNSSDIFK